MAGKKDSSRDVEDDHTPKIMTCSNESFSNVKLHIFSFNDDFLGFSSIWIQVIVLLEHAQPIIMIFIGNGRDWDWMGLGRLELVMKSYWRLAWR